LKDEKEVFEVCGTTKTNLEKGFGGIVA